MVITKYSLAIGALLGLCATSFGQGMAYGVDAQRKLWYVDLSDASATLIGDLDFTATGLGMDSSGNLYAGRSNGSLYKVSTVNATTTFIGSMGIGLSATLDWDETNSRMLAADDSLIPKIYSVNLLTGATTLVMTGTSGTAQIQSMSVRGATSTMDVRHNSGIPSEGGDKHGTFDFSTGTYTTYSGIFSEILGIDHGTDGLLYGMSRIGRLIRIDTADASETDIGLINGGVGFTSMATETVPEPATMAALGLGAAALIRRRRKA